MSFPDGERLIFSYHDGKATVWGDPLAIRRRLTRALEGDLNAVYLACYGPEPTGDDGQPRAETAAERLARVEAAEQLLSGVREAFALIPFDPATGQGATDRHVEEALFAFFDFLDTQKKSTGS